MNDISEKIETNKHLNDSSNDKIFATTTEKIINETTIKMSSNPKSDKGFFDNVLQNNTNIQRNRIYGIRQCFSVSLRLFYLIFY